MSNIANRLYSYVTMSAPIIQSANCIFSRSDFINEITSSTSSEEVCLGKRSTQENFRIEGEAGLKLRIKEAPSCIKGSFDQDTVVNCSSVHESLKLLSGISSPCQSEGSVSNGHTVTPTLITTKQTNKQLNSVLSDQMKCQKLLLKHFLTETVTNEKFNHQRFKFLPETCQNLVLNYLETHFNFDFEVELKKGSARKYLYALRGRTYATADKSSVSLSFLTDCYVYGLQKQLNLKSKLVGVKDIATIIQNKLEQAGVKLDSTKFSETMEELLEYNNSVSQEKDIHSILSSCLIDKMANIQEATLAKFHQMKLHKSLSNLIDSSTSLTEIQDNFSKDCSKVDILSALMGKPTASCPKQYRTTPLNIC